MIDGQLTSTSISTVASGPRLGDVMVAKLDACVEVVRFPRISVLFMKTVTSGMRKWPAKSMAPRRLLTASVYGEPKGTL